MFFQFDHNPEDGFMIPEAGPIYIAAPVIPEIVSDLAQECEDFILNTRDGFEMNVKA